MASTVTLARSTATLRMHTAPVADDTVTVGNVTYTFKATPSAANEVDVAATKAGSIANLVAAINLTGSAGATTYHADTVVNPFATAEADGEVITLTARSGGVMLAPVATLDGTAATAVLTFTADAADTDEIYIGNVVYVFKTTPAAAYDVDVGGAGANQAGSLANLIAAINATGSAGAQTYYAGTLVNPYVSAAVTETTKMLITARIAGTQGNGIFTGTSEGDITWADTTCVDGAKGNDFWDESVTEVAAAGVLTFAADPVDTDEIYIGDATYVFKDTPASAGDVDVGATRPDSIANLINAINLTGSAGASTYHADTVKNPYVTAALTSANVVTVTAIVPGIQANAIQTSTSEGDMTFAATTLVGGTGASAVETRFEGGTGSVDSFLTDMIAHTEVSAEVLMELKKLTAAAD